MLLLLSAKAGQPYLRRGDMRASTVGLLLGVGVVAACSGGGGGGGGGGAPTTGAVRLNNWTGYTIHEMYAALSSSPDWGPVQNSSPIPSSGSFTLTNMPPGVWDFEAVSIGTYSPFFSYSWDNPLAAGETLFFDLNANYFTGSLSVYNGHAYSITQLYVAPTWASSWGPNQLSQAVAPGYSWLVYDADPDDYDVMCVHSNGDSSSGTWGVASFSVTSITCD